MSARGDTDQSESGGSIATSGPASLPEEAFWDNAGLLEDLETRKDTVQVAVESAVHHVGQIAGIIAGAGREVTRELGDWATEVFEMRQAARRARADRESLTGEDPRRG